MTTDQKKAHVQGQIDTLQAERWMQDSNAKACARAGLAERAEAIAKQSADTDRLIAAFQEQLAELSMPQARSA